MSENEPPLHVATTDSERRGALRLLIARGKLQGYLIRSDTMAMLPVALFPQEVHDDILKTISDMGIPIVDAAPTAAQLAAMQVPPATDAPKLFVSSSHTGQPIGAPFVVLHVGAEGGEIRLIAQQMTTGWRYRYTMLDQTDLWLEEGGAEIRRQSPWVYEWNDALVALDRYPWAELRPLEINPRFADQILTAARNRLAKGTASLCSGRGLAAWSTLCHG